MEHTVVRLTGLFTAPDAAAARRPDFVISRGNLVVPNGAAAPGWQAVTATSDDRVAADGFLPDDNLMERAAAGPVDPEIDVPRFISALTTAARAIGANRDYLALVAMIESGIRNIPNGAGGAAFGPFQFMPDTWADLVARHGATQGLTAEGRIVPAEQAIAAAIYTREATEALIAATDTVPSPSQLYLAHVAGRSGASKLLRLDPDRPVSDGLVPKAIDNNAGLFKDGAGRVRDVAAVLEAIAGRLEAAQARLAPVMSGLAADLRVGGPAGSLDLPWMVAAVAELRRTPAVAEVDGPGSNPEIEKYFEAAGSGARLTDATPWCAAFVAFCLQTSGNDAAAKSNIRSLRAADWLDWGTETVADPPVCALAILRPLVADSSGHVAFVVGINDTHVTLLGGNQDNAVNETPFKRSDVVRYRWLQGF